MKSISNFESKRVGEKLLKLNLCVNCNASPINAVKSHSCIKIHYSLFLTALKITLVIFIVCLFFKGQSDSYFYDH